MSRLFIEPTQTAQWHRLVRDASSRGQRELDENIESYVVFLLMRFTRETHLSDRPLAIEYLESLTSAGTARKEGLREVGDKCLLFAGLFPQLAERKTVRLGYFVDMGRSAYAHLAELLSHSAGELYQELAHTFVGVIEVLHTIRGFSQDPALTPLQAAEFFQDTGSRIALENYTRAMPVHADLQRKDH